MKQKELLIDILLGIGLYVFIFLGNILWVTWYPLWQELSDSYYWMFSMVVGFLLFALFGLYFGLVHYLRYEFSKNGKWRFQIRKLFIWGTPPILLLSWYLLYYMNIIDIRPIEYILNNGVMFSNITVASGVLLGYSIAIGFYKKSENQ